MPDVSNWRARRNEDAYALGLWCADGYWWSSSIGLSNVDPNLIIRFGTFLKRSVGPDRLRLRVYVIEGDNPDPVIARLHPARVSRVAAHKMKRTAYHVYVNSRPLLRAFRAEEEDLGQLDPLLIPAYIAGRFDGDGSLGSPSVPGIRIVYATEIEARADQEILKRVGVRDSSVYLYAKARESCLYVKSSQVQRVLSMITPYSTRLQRDLSATPVRVRL